MQRESDLSSGLTPMTLEVHDLSSNFTLVASKMSLRERYTAQHVIPLLPIYGSREKPSSYASVALA